MTPAEYQQLREQLADVQHAIWAHWMRYQFSVCQRNEDGSIIIPAEKVERWSRQMETPYAGLTDKERESDRHQADKVLSVLAQPVSPIPGWHYDRGGNLWPDEAQP